LVFSQWLTDYIVRMMLYNVHEMAYLVQRYCNAGVQMRAIVQEKYGSTAVLHAGEIEKPVIGDTDVLVRVEAASVHLGDWILMTGRPYVMRMATGIRRPRVAVPGTDVSGIVEAVGKDVRGFRTGDAVFGWCEGAFAEYAAAGEHQFVTNPARLTFEQAAAVGVSATTALQLLRDNGKVEAGQKVLINGASGGVGTFAVQIAKAMGAEVTAVCSTANVELVRSIGADHVVDYTREDFTKGQTRYDLILDNVGNHSMARTRRALAPTGTLISNGGGHADGKLGRTLRTMLASMFVRQQAAPSVKTQNAADLVALKRLVDAGSITPVIDGTYPLTETAKAIGRVATGHARGTVVITIGPLNTVTDSADSVAPVARTPRLIDKAVAPIAASPPA
jgi:NADPH:quinone reductase-like Zn-dependent oxidoreductase